MFTVIFPGMYQILELINPMLTFSVLSVTYIAMLHLSIECYGRHMLLYLVLSVCAINDICHHSFISLNFLRLLSIVAGISTRFSMTSHSENVALNAITFNMMTRHFMEFVQSFCSKTDHFTSNWGTNMIEHCIWDGIVYNFSNFRKVWWLEPDSFIHTISVAETIQCARSFQIVHIGRLFWTINKCFNLLSTMGVSCPEELSNVVTPHPKETSTLKVKQKWTIQHLMNTLHSIIIQKYMEFQCFFSILLYDFMAMTMLHVLALVHNIKHNLPVSLQVRTYLLPASKLLFRKSLKGLICCSFVNSTWLAIFCMILHISVRPRFIRGVGCCSIIPDSHGETKNIRKWTSYKYIYETGARCA